MDRRQRGRGELGLEQPATVTGHPDLTPQECLRRGRAEADENVWLHDGQLPVQPRPAGRDLAPVRFLVDAPLSARLPLEVLDHVRDIGVRAVDAGLRERFVEEAPRRTDEGPAGEVLTVAGLLADEKQPSALQTFAEDGLRARPPERAGGAVSRGLA